jgi:hypothetical protein
VLVVLAIQSQTVIQVQGALAERTLILVMTVLVDVQEGPEGRALGADLAPKEIAVRLVLRVVVEAVGAMPATQEVQVRLEGPGGPEGAVKQEPQQRLIAFLLFQEVHIQ